MVVCDVDLVSITSSSAFGDCWSLTAREWQVMPLEAQVPFDIFSARFFVLVLRGDMTCWENAKLEEPQLVEPAHIFISYAQVTSANAEIGLHQRA